MSWDLRGLDKWITGGRYRKDDRAEVFCHDPECADYGDLQVVTYEEEYGAGWYTPDQCPACGGDWHDTAPPDVELYVDGRRR